MTSSSFSELFCISTHALTEGDAACKIIVAAEAHFNSRPHGGRRLTLLLLYFGVIFQLTPSRRATTVNVSSLIVTVISTHALTEGDELLPACAEPAEKFQLTPSRRATDTPVITEHR